MTSPVPDTSPHITKTTSNPTSLLQNQLAIQDANNISFLPQKEDNDLAKATKEDFKTAILADMLKLNTVWLIVDYFTIYNIRGPKWSFPPPCRECRNRIRSV